MIPDDMESSPGSTTSLLRTIVGTSLRRLGGWIAVAHLIELAGTVGLPAPRARTALARVKARGLLRAEARDGVPGYALAPDAVPMLERGDRRIFGPRSMADDDRWCLVSYSVPEENRDLRHQLRRRLTWVGCGVVSPGLWICPEYLTDEVSEILADLGPASRATVFRAEVLTPFSAGQWWDLDAIRARHEAFLAGAPGWGSAGSAGGGPSAVGSAGGEPAAVGSAGGGPAAAAYRVWIRGLDSWRIIPYVDPGLPARLLPADWPGERSTALFLELRDRVLPQAHLFVDQVVSARPLAALSEHGQH